MLISTEAARLSYGELSLHHLDRSFASPSFNGFAVSRELIVQLLLYWFFYGYQPVIY